MRRAFLLLALMPVIGHAKTFYLTIAGLGGEPEYEQRFQGLAAEADKAFRAAGGDIEVTTLKGPQATKAAIRSSLDQIARSATGRDTLVLLMIGHGSFDGADYKFNIPGPDITAAELAELLNKVVASPQLIVDTTSASGALTKPLERANRIVLTATRDGMEKNATVFARFFVEALHDNSADTDKNETVTVLEAFNFAQRKTKEFYDEQKRIVTEHAVLNDSGHASQFPVVRFGSAATAAADPAKKQLLVKRDDLEAKIDALKQQKNMLSPDDYRKQLAALLLDLARTQQEIDK